MWDDIVRQLNEKKEAYLAVRVTTNAVKTELREVMADKAFKIALRAIPEKGKANAELIRFLASEFDLDKNNITIINGASERTKLIKISL